MRTIGKQGARSSCVCRVSPTYPVNWRCRMSALCYALCWIILCLACILQHVPHRHVGFHLFGSTLSKMHACIVDTWPEAAKASSKLHVAINRTSLTSMGVSFAASALPLAMGPDSELSALVACRSCNLNSDLLSSVLPLACLPCCRRQRERAEGLTAPGRPSTRQRCRSPNRVLRSSSSWWMAWSGRLRMTASSARTHMGSRALSCTTGSLQQSRPLSRDALQIAAGATPDAPSVSS